MNVNIIGGGHIGGACAFGFCKAKVGKIIVTTRTLQTLQKYQNTGIETTLDNRSAVLQSEIVVIAVKTAQIISVLSDIKDCLKGKIVVCMAAQVTPDVVGQYADNLIYAIPNTAAEYCKSVTFLSNISASAAAYDKVRTLFESIGICVSVDYQMLPAGISVASCGIAYAMQYIASAAQGAVELGFDYTQAVSIICKTVEGAVKVVETHQLKPEEEVRKVATPGGLTEKGIDTMLSNGFTKSVIKGLKASMK